MVRHWKRWFLAPVLTLSLVLTSCEPDARDTADLPSGPEATGNELLWWTPPATVITARDGEDYTLVEGRIPDLIGDLSVSKLIGAAGGALHLAGHRLTVPAGAVTQPALFTLTVTTNGYVEVDLRAVVIDLWSGRIDIGSTGFDEPVTLSLTYAWASNVEDPQELTILRMDEDAGYADGDHEPLPATVDETGKRVTVELGHFSAYCMVST